MKNKHKNIRIVLCLFATSLLLSCKEVAATDFNECKKYESNSEFIQLKNCLYPYAENGEPKAQLILGTLYSDGLGVSADRSRAKQWYLRAAQKNMPEAQYLLGLTYSEENNLTESKSWLLKAANQGYSPAQKQLGIFNLYSSENYDEALYWFNKAANSNNDEAHYWLGVMYYEGIGVKKNTQEASETFRKS